MNTIHFKQPFSKLFYNNTLQNQALLLQVFKSKFEDLTQEFKDWDGDGIFDFPPKGECLVMLFQRPGGIFTTVRKATKENVLFYSDRVGQMFKVEVSVEK